MSTFDRKVLVLDSRFEPVKVVTLQAGFVLLYTERASVIVDSDRMLRGVSQSFKVPWIVRLNNCSPKGRRLLGPRFSRQNIYLRDGYRCQYCSWSGPIVNLTMDHLIPCAKGGRTTWENIVTACKACNVRKGAYSLDELGIRLHRMPIRPKMNPGSLFALRYGLNRKNIPKEWAEYVDLAISDRLLAASSLEPKLSKSFASGGHQKPSIPVALS